MTLIFFDIICFFSENVIQLLVVFGKNIKFLQKLSNLLLYLHKIGKNVKFLQKSSNVCGFLGVG